MEVARVASATIDLLGRDYNLTLSLAIIILIFALYVYLFPTPLSEYFTDRPPRKYPQISIE